jgi:hypothetical protein
MTARSKRSVRLGLALTAAILTVGVANAQPPGADALFQDFQSPPRDPSAGPRVSTSPGFSHTGDAQVQPLEAMKKLVWSTTRVTGGQAVSEPLPAPPDNSGPFQNFPYTTESPWTHAVDRTFYRDVAVFAYRAPPTRPAGQPIITSSAGPIDAARLAAGDPRHPFALAKRDGAAWIQFDYPAPQTLRTVVLATPEIRIDSAMYADLQAFDAKGHPIRVARLDMRETAHVTASFPAVTAKRFRLVFARRPLAFEPIVQPGGPDVVVSDKAIDFFKTMRNVPADFPIALLALRPDARVNEFERKAGFFTFVNDYYALATPAEAGPAVSKRDVVDLSGRLRPDGSLDWTPPPGQWEVVRLGYSLTGQVSHPEQPGVSGLEVDKFDLGHMRTYLTRQLDRALSDPRARNAQWLFADSIEAGPQNWTDDMLAQFHKRRGYDPRPFLPALTGVVVESAAATDKFLWDYRQTQADLLHEVTFKTIADMGHARGLKVAMEALETGRHTFGDDFEMRRYADQPVGALWGSAPLADYLKDYPNQVADQRGAASIAHFYGRPTVGAESGTDLEHPGTTSPRTLKPLVDLEFAFGVNSLQRSGGGPGEPWMPYMEDWTRYLARTSFLLQQGRPVADVAYYYGQEGPLVAMRDRIADAPKTVGFDFINTEALLDGGQVKNGRLLAPSGLQYRVLQLGGSSRKLTVPVMRKLRDLVRGGLTVVGRAPDDTPSLADDPNEFRGLRAELWGPDGKGASLGKGRVDGAAGVEAVLAKLGVGPDLAINRGQVGVDVLFQHRALGDGDLYFVMSRSAKGGPVELSFRQAGRAPELWRADGGERLPLSYRALGGRTVVPLTFRPNDAVFVVFRDRAAAGGRTLPARTRQTVAKLDGDWQASFPGARGAAPHVVPLKTGSWTATDDPAVRYFSGVATYGRTIDVPPAALAGGGKLLLSLGDVRELADVSVNGVKVGIRWSPPYEFDVTAALKPGPNRIEVKVANLAANRMIGAKQPGAPAAGAAGGFSLVEYRPDAPLRPSGIIGPAALIREH